MKNSDTSDHYRQLAKQKMSLDQYCVCFEKCTEPPFSGKYWDNKEEGSYNCASCNQLLFDSKEKFNSGTGWPSFYDANKSNIIEIIDKSHWMKRKEVICSKCGCHLGHVFKDGPAPTGLRYCINSASIELKKREKQ